MANRTYLFAIDTLDTHKATTRSMIGLGEYNYNTPLIYRILCSSGTKTCRSSIFKGTQKTAIVADFKSGVKRLRFFLEQLKQTEFADLIRNTLDWLDEPHNQFEYVLLEPSEIFDLEAGAHQPLLEELLQNIQTLDDETLITLAKDYQDHNAMASWSNFLYYEPQGCVKPPKDKKADRHTFSVDELEKYLSDLERFQCSHLTFYAANHEIDRAKKLLPELNRLPNLTTFWPKGEAVLDEVGQLTSIKRLILTNNQLEALPAGLGKLTQLEELFLPTNKFTRVPEVVRSLEKLRMLILGKNQLIELPQWLSELKHLEDLRANENNLRDLPSSISKLTNLRKVNLTVNELDNPREMLEKLSSLPNIESISITGNHSADLKLNGVPTLLWKKLNLKALALIGMAIPDVPPDIKHLRNLSRLSLHNCGIRTINENLWQLTGLESLNLASNPIGKLSPNIAKLTQLTDLNLSSCELDKLPDVFQSHRQLTNIQLRNNNLSEVPLSIRKVNGEQRKTVNLFENPVYSR